MTPAERLGIEAEQEAFNKALLGEDDLGVVVRAQIHIENQLIEFIRATMSPASAVDALDLDYAGRVKLALALGLSPTFKPALTFVGGLRNRFAHRLDTHISAQEALNFQNALGPEKQIRDRSYAATRKKLALIDKPIAVSRLDPKDRILLCFVTLWGGIAVSVAKAKAAAI
ncbi:hypothetical protein [Bosea beijingensis]